MTTKETSPTAKEANVTTKERRFRNPLPTNHLHALLAVPHYILLMDSQRITIGMGRKRLFQGKADGPCSSYAPASPETLRPSPRCVAPMRVFKRPTLFSVVYLACVVHMLFTLLSEFRRLVYPVCVLLSFLLTINNLSGNNFQFPPLFH